MISLLVGTELGLEIGATDGCARSWALLGSKVVAVLGDIGTH